jgi:hypothetical protein
LRDRRFQIALDVDRERFQRRNVKGVKAAAVRRLFEIDQGRQEPRQRLAGSGRRDQKRILPGAGGAQKLHLVRPRRPAPRGKPVQETGRQLEVRTSHKGLHQEILSACGDDNQPRHVNTGVFSRRNWLNQRNSKARVMGDAPYIGLAMRKSQVRANLVIIVRSPLGCER